MLLLSGKLLSCRALARFCDLLSCHVHLSLIHSCLLSAGKNLPSWQTVHFKKALVPAASDDDRAAAEGNLLPALRKEKLKEEILKQEVEAEKLLSNKQEVCMSPWSLCKRAGRFSVTGIAFPSTPLLVLEGRLTLLRPPTCSYRR